jgi:hypothetical protein
MIHTAHEQMGDVLCSAKMEKLSEKNLEYLAKLLHSANFVVAEIAMLNPAPRDK